MKSLIICIGIVLTLMITAIYACCKVAGDVDRWEENNNG